MMDDGVYLAKKLEFAIKLLKW